ncbi:MAG: porin, partial [Gallionellaceae bacterium]|nr:porin [Gallionellaceae bacterium]
MQKKIIALAIAAAFSAPAFADNANITVYGKAILDVESVSNDKSTLSRSTRVQTNASRLGFKGKEDLGDGLSGWFQFEVQMDADGNGANGLANGTRNSGVGIDSGFGTIMMGVWDTPFKLAHNKIELFDNTTVFSATNLIGRSGSNSYVTRRSNVVQYWSPSLGGVKVNVSHSPDEGTSAGAATTQGFNKSQTSMSAVYDDKDSGVYVAAAYEMRPDATTKATTDSAMRLVARYEMGDFWVGATFEGIKVNSSATVNYTQNNMELAANMKMGTSSVGLSYVKNGDTSTAKTNASQFTLRYGYNFTKRTEVFAAYASLKNDTAGT